MHYVKLTSLPLLSVQFSDFRDIHGVMHPTPLFFPKTLVSPRTETLYPLGSNFPFFPSPPLANLLYFLCLCICLFWLLHVPFGDGLITLSIRSCTFFCLEARVSALRFSVAES